MVRLSGGNRKHRGKPGGDVNPGLLQLVDCAGRRRSLHRQREVAALFGGQGLGRPSPGPACAKIPVSGRKLVLVSFQVNSIQRPPSWVEKTARTLADSRTHSGAPSPSRSAVQTTAAVRGTSTRRIGTAREAPPAILSVQSRTLLAPSAGNTRNSTRRSSVGPMLRSVFGGRNSMPRPAGSSW